MSDLEQAFHQAMLNTYTEAARSINYRPTQFLQMVNQSGGLATARALLQRQEVSDGFTRLWEAGRLDLSVEAQALRPEFAPLFTPQELERARQRLADAGYTPPWLDGAPPATETRGDGAQPASLLDRLARAVQRVQSASESPPPEHSNDTGVTGAEAGISGAEQIRIALQIMVENGGTAETVADSPQQWPEADAPAFVLVHGEDWGEQHYGERYTFTIRAGGEPRRLLEALEQQRQGGPPVHVVIYRTGPYFAFTAWARVTDITEGPPNESGHPVWKLDLDQHEFPVPLKLKGNAGSLTQRLPWLSKGLATAFRGHSIREISPEEFRTIIDAAKSATQEGGPMSMADAAFNILTRAGGGPLSLSAILEHALYEGLIAPSGQTPQLSLSTAMLRDPRFHHLGKNMWILANPVDPQPERVPAIYAGPDAGFWRIHFPRELWDEARKHGVIGIDWPLDSTNQSVKRLKRIKVGDRVVAYIQGGTIGGIGVVTRPYYDIREQQTPDAAVFGGSYPQRIGVAWADAPAKPIPILEQLKEPANTDLYNRLKNPHTVIPLSRDDYVALLSLLGVDDAGTPTPETRLPSAWPSLKHFRDFIQRLDDQAYTAGDLLGLARAFGAGLNEDIDEEALVDDLRQLRLVGSEGDETYRRRPYTSGDAAALLRLMALALLVPAEGAEDLYTLPALSIMRRLRSAAMPQPIEQFAPELGPDSHQLLSWYAEAGLVLVESDQWRWAEAAFEPLDGDDPASAAYNEFLRVLQAELNGRLVSELEDVGGPLPPALNLADQLAELGQELLIDTSTVRRIYRSLMAGRHVVLSGPPGTGKTELAKRLPMLLWQEEPQTLTRLTTDLGAEPVESRVERRSGYLPVVVTATEDWGVRDVVGGIGPRLDGERGELSFNIQYGRLTQTILKHYAGTGGGRRLPAPPYIRRDYRENGERYRGAWLVIDEFTRAPIDAAFGSLLTTLGGGDHAALSVPAGDGRDVALPLPADFRIIGTLNSFDRHFLNQMSEALKRRFDFIDVLPPPPAQAPYERGIAAMQALRRLHANGFAQISVEGEPPAYHWAGVLSAQPVLVDGLHRYELRVEDSTAAAALDSFWRLFEAVRVFRQLGTAQAIAVYAILFAGVLVEMPWDEALDAALADSLADQLQVMTRDEQRMILLYTEHAGDARAFAQQLAALKIPLSRLATLLHAFREADEVRNGSSDIDTSGTHFPSAEQLGRVFNVGEPLVLPRPSAFRRRLRSLMSERGL